MSGTGMESSISLYQDYSGTSIMYITYFIDDKKTLILSHLVSIDPNQISICIHSGNFKDLYYTAGYWNGQPTGEKIYVEFK